MSSKLIKEISTRLTIENIVSGESIFIPDNKITKNAVRVTCHRLNKKGFNFVTTEKNIKGGIIVTRHK